MLLIRKDFLTRNIMGNTVSSNPRGHRTGNRPGRGGSFSLYSQDSSAGIGGAGFERKYLNQSERRRMMAATETLDRRSALLVLTLAWTGARVSEVLALTPRSFQVEQSLVAIVTLKRRRWCVREVPIPPELMTTLADEFSLPETQRNLEGSDARLWPACRTTAWRLIKRVTERAGLSGRSASPRGLRHAFGIGMLQAGVPITLVQRWLGHARLSTTSIYAEAAGPEELAFARRYWTSPASLATS